MTQIRFVNTLTLTLVTVLIALAPGLVVAQDGADTLPNGVAAGDVTQTSAVLWAHSTVPGTATFEYTEGTDFATLTGTVQAEVTDPMEPVKVLVEGLAPGTLYSYRVTDAAGSTAAGTFRTPAELGTYTGLRFGVSGDWRGELAPYPSIKNALARDLDFFVAHGDTIYADYPSPDLEVPQATTLEDYRIKNNEVYSARYGMNTLAELRAATAIFATIDDHEVTNDFAGGAAPESDTRFSNFAGALINETELFANGLQAFQEYNPVQDEFYGDTGDARTANKRKLYRYRTFGSDAALFVLDTRSFRDEGLDPVQDLTDQAQAIAFLSGAYNPQRTLLGQAQFAQLTVDLLAAQDAGVMWKFVLIPEPMQTFGLLLAEDRYEGYYAERTKLLKFINENAITNVVFISADIHGTVVNNLEYKENILADPTPTGAFDISTGAVAFDAPFGPTVVNLALDAELITQEQYDTYYAMTLPERDAFIETMANLQVDPLGYTPVGLQDAELIDAELVTGGYVATQYYGWTEFAIDAETQALRVITYGIEPYSQSELDADPEAITSREPEIVSEFVVQPQ